ncbi:hypothetical protein E4U42_007150, partial [Claviceps africana]
MLSKSLVAARAAVRDLFRGAHGRGRERCWGESAGGGASWTTNEGGLLGDVVGWSSVGLVGDGMGVASEDTFVTSRSWQSNLTDLPAPAKDHAIIKEGPRRRVSRTLSGPAVEETYLVLDWVPASPGQGNDLGKAGYARPSTQRAGMATTESGEEVSDGEPRACDAASPAGYGRITASTLFAYRAMNVRSARGDAARLRREVARDAMPWPESEPRDQDSPFPPRVLPTNGTGTDQDYPSTPQADATRDAAEAAFAYEYDISDDEGDAPGRISPRTFRLWATASSSQQVLPGQDDASCSPAQSGLADDDDDDDDDDASTWSSGAEALEWNHILQWQNRMPSPRPDAPLPSPVRSPGQVTTLTH